MSSADIIIWIFRIQLIVAGATLFIHFDTRPNKKTRKKIKIIRKLEDKMEHEIVNQALEEFTENYAKEHKINWREYLTDPENKEEITNGRNSYK